MFPSCQLGNIFFLNLEIVYISNRKKIFDMKIIFKNFKENVEKILERQKIERQ